MSSAAGGPGGGQFGVGVGQGVSGRMGEQGGLRTGWLAAFGTEGYEGEPPLLEELGVNFGHIKVKVSCHDVLYLLFIPLRHQSKLKEFPIYSCGKA